MAHLQYFSYAGVGERKHKEMHYNQAVRIGDRIEISGQGGWDIETGIVHSDLVKQIDQAYANVDLALRIAGGAGWSEVYRVRIYYTSVSGSEEGFAAMIGNLKKWCPDHQPILTGVKVAGLADPGMEVEIEVAAHVPSEN
ncbi:endoribonuclease L-PSP [Auricularia subglabra TFB-10046 SS5]|uniref:Endoribonuclease L-PSP n=1 Tax=Auricularia subglabra (strain TFB-10046 / SS5) TaxID=717982 RepID=J0CXS8_AURST|nr:endoribonuclease L-PSP [Auricularia subglabra TFB-10046 SS5]